MKVIWKFPLFLGKSNMLLPVDSKVLSIGVQNQGFVMWVEIDKRTDKTKDEFLTVCTYMTGEEFDSKDHRFVGSAECNGMVVHTYQVG